jgi:N-acetylmuramoyl-L-alanine amidase
MSSLENTKRRIIREAIQSNLEGPLVKARKNGLHGRILRWSFAAILGATAVLAVTSIVMAKSNAVPSIAHAASPAPAIYSAAHTEASVPSAPPTDLDHAVLPLSIKRIVIDPGHGGEQAGAISAGGLQEKDVTLDIALRLRRLMGGSPFEVRLTRESDKTVSLAERVAFANSHKADLFVSIHINSMQPRSVHPLETFFVGPNQDPHVLQLAGIENRDSGYSFSEYRQLLDKVFLDARRNESHLLAKSIDEELYQSLKQRNPELQDRGVKTAPFAVLMGTEMPAVLAEVSSVSNAGDAQLLQDGQYRQRIAEALFKGITSYANNLNDYRSKGIRPDGKT